MSGEDLLAWVVVVGCSIAVIVLTIPATCQRLMAFVYRRLYEYE